MDSFIESDVDEVSVEYVTWYLRCTETSRKTQDHQRLMSLGITITGRNITLWHGNSGAALEASPQIRWDTVAETTWAFRRRIYIYIYISDFYKLDIHGKRQSTKIWVFCRLTLANPIIRIKRAFHIKNVSQIAKLHRIHINPMSIAILDQHWNTDI